MTSTHYIKITKPHFEAVLDGSKRAEIRQNDRGYQKGDTLFLEEVEVVEVGKLEHTGRVIKATASYVTNYLQKEGVVVISIIPVAAEDGGVDDGSGKTRANSKRANDKKRPSASAKGRSKKRK